jgi:hypothetical protein
MSDRLVNSTIDFLDRRTKRRGFLLRSAVIGSAIAVAPLRYLLRPGTAWGTVTCTYGDGCGDYHSCTCPSCTCSQAPCQDGYTTFCCTINNGSNTCPADTFIGGWWQCDSSGYCLDGQHKPGPRYYLDCNSICGTGSGDDDGGGDCTSCGQDTGELYGAMFCDQGGTCDYGCISQRCHCANGDCTNRATACNWFRYNQCNTAGHPCSGPVVCRLVSCNPPWVEHSCKSTAHSDPATCTHNASCL